MSQYLETLDQRESLGKALAASLAFHGGVVGVLAFSGSRATEAQRLGQSESRRRSVGVNVVKSIPLPSRAGAGESAGQRQQDHGSSAAAARRSPSRRRKRRQPDAIPIPSKKARQEEATERASSEDHLPGAGPGRTEPDLQRYRAGAEIAPDRADGTGAIGVGEGLHAGESLRLVYRPAAHQGGPALEPGPAEHGADHCHLHADEGRIGARHQNRAAQRQFHCRLLRRNAPFSTPRHFLRCPTERALPPISNLCSTRGDDEESCHSWFWVSWSECSWSWRPRRATLSTSRSPSPAPSPWRLPICAAPGAAQPLMSVFNTTLYDDLKGSGLFKHRAQRASCR